MTAGDGKPCKRCGTNKWWGSDCAECSKRRSQQWSEANPERRREHKYKWARENPELARQVHRESYRRNYKPKPRKTKAPVAPKERPPKQTREERREARRQWARNNPDKSRERARRWYWNNREAAREKERQRWLRNPERELERNREWRQANPDKVAASRHRRRARKNGAPGDFTAEEFRQLCEQYDNKCLACGRDDLPLTADHVIPLSWEGATNDIGNIQPLCGPCNTSKKDRHATDYRTKRRRRGWIQQKLFNRNADD